MAVYLQQVFVAEMGRFASLDEGGIKKFGWVLPSY
jgi:hypothetical protein